MSKILATSPLPGGPLLPGEAPTLEGRLADIFATAVVVVDDYQLSDADKAKVVEALRAAAAKEWWRPITSAPKDGTFIWLTDGSFLRIGYWYVVTADASKEHWADFALAEVGRPSDLAFVPTHWQPLPAGPPKGWFLVDAR